jgi:hypothetical protein
VNRSVGSIVIETASPRRRGALSESGGAGRLAGVRGG